MSESNFPGEGVRALRLQIGQQSIAAFESAGTGRPIVLIHGNSASSKVWQKQFEGPLGAKISPDRDRPARARRFRARA